MILDNDEDLPLISIGITRPGFILHGITALGLHFVAGVEACPSPAFAHGLHLFPGSDLNAEMRKRALLARRNPRRFARRRLVQREVEGGLAEIEFRVIA